ncbi:ECs_2282 family putative zinc-binding protein [Pantoea septica]|uniref:ECs_2282 family putative zinc-binding protein n=1 Tax=Pantoea septica TaxID=472695 RepID=UPI003A5232F9
MGRVKIRCPACGERRFQFTLKNDAKRTPHGAVCLRCGRPVKSDSLFQLCLVPPRIFR